MTNKEKLIENMEAEFQLFLLEAMEKPPEEILKLSYEKVMKEDIIFGLREYELSKKKVDYLLTCEYPLDELYQNWLKSDISYMEELMASVDNFVYSGLTSEKQKER